jgi:hypothetical protein
MEVGTCTRVISNGQAEGSSDGMLRGEKKNIDQEVGIRGGNN